MTAVDERKKMVRKNGFEAVIEYQCTVCEGEMCNSEWAQVLSGGSAKHALVGLAVATAATTFLL